MKALLLILGLTMSLGVFATEDSGKGYGEDQEGCGKADELKGCKCIKQSINPEDATTGDSGSSEQDSGKADGTSK